MNSAEINQLIESLANMKNISKEEVISCLEEAVLASVRKRVGINRIVEVEFNKIAGEVEVYEFLKVIPDDEETREYEINLTEAKKYDPECIEDDEIGVKIENEKLGRITANMTKQAIRRRLKAKEASKIYKNFKSREGELITGSVIRIEQSGTVINLGSVEGIIPRRFNPFKERYKIGDKVKAYIEEVNESENFYQVILSRTSPNFVAKLLENEVPEIASGQIEIKEIVRQAGIRTKVAVSSNGANVDPIKTTIGYSGVKIKAVKREIFGERIDVILYDEDVVKFACNCLFPVIVERVLIDSVNRKMDITVPDDQTTLAIGKNKINLKLTEEITGWRINILSHSEDKENRENAIKEFEEFDFLNALKINTLYNFGIKNKDDVKNIDIEFISNIPMIGKELAQKMKKCVQ